MADPLSLALSVAEKILLQVKNVRTNHAECELLEQMVDNTLKILRQLEERLFDAPTSTALELVTDALQEALEAVNKCCNAVLFIALLYNENHALALKHATQKLKHALAQIPLASLGMTDDVQSDLVKIKAQIRNAKFEERASVAHPIQGLRDAMERAFNQISQGTDEVKDLIQKLVQEHISSKEELRNELVGLKQFAFEANQNKEKLQEFELNQIISVISESLGDVSEVPRDVYDLEDCYLCPISKDIMRDPVVLKDSCMIYDRSSITEWLRRGHRSDPLTNIELVSRELVPNRVLRKTCQIILQQSGGQSSVIPSLQEEKEVLEQHIEPGLYEGQGKFFVGSSVIHTSQVLVLGPNGKVVGCTLYAGEILGVKGNGIDIGAGEWDSDTHEFSFGDCQFSYNGSIQLKTNVHQRGIEWSGRVSKGDALEEDYEFNLVYYPPSIGHEIPAHPTILEMESKAMKIRGDISCDSKAVLSLERDSSVDGWISFESACLETKRIGRISRGSWNENGQLAFLVFFPSNDTPLNSHSRPTNYEACFTMSGTLTHGQMLPSPTFSGIFMKMQEQGALRSVKAVSSPLESLRVLEYPIIREASTPWHCLLQNPLKIFHLSRNFELKRSQYAVRETLATQYGPILHSQRALGISPLHVASANNSTDLVKELIARGADINLTDNNGQSPLHHASFTNSIDAVKELVSKDVEIDLQDKVGKSPLHVALNNNSTLVIKALANNGANINLQDNDGSTPLHHAILKNSIDIIKSLISKGADMYIQDKHGRSPLQIALDKNNADVIEELLGIGANIDLQDNDGWSKLHHAANHNVIDIVKKLIVNGAKVNIQNNNGESPLYVASRSGHIDIVKELIVNGADVNLQNKNGASPLHIASRNGRVDVVKELIVNGADVDLRLNDGRSSLYTASYNGHIEVVKEHIVNGADVNLQKNDGASPLYVTSQNGHIDVVKELIVNGADINLQEKDGASPLFKTSYEGHIDVVKELIVNGADVNLQRNDGASPLLIASEMGHIDVVKELIVNGADVNLQDNNGEFPLYIAARNGHVHIVKELIVNGANVDLPMNGGWTPLHIASFRGLVSIVKILLENGASKEIRNNQGKNPYDVVRIDLGTGSIEDSTIRELQALLKPASQKQVG